jgi:hypothetical protein
LIYKNTPVQQNRRFVSDPIWRPFFAAPFLPCDRGCYMTAVSFHSLANQVSLPELLIQHFVLLFDLQRHCPVWQNPRKFPYWLALIPAAAAAWNLLS